MANPYWVPMVANAVRILELFFDAGGDFSLQEINARTSVTKTSAFRILHTLERLGYLYRDPDTGRFCLTPKILRAARHSLPGADLVAIAHPQLEQLREHFNETVNFATLINGQAVYLDIVESRQSFRMVADVGQPVPLHSTAIGKCFLAFWPRADLKTVLKKIKYKRFTPNTASNARELARVIAVVRRRGYASDNEENEIGASCIGVPVLDQSNRAMAALSISGPSARILKDSPQMVRSLRKAAALIAGKAAFM